MNIYLVFSFFQLIYNFLHLYILQNHHKIIDHIKENYKHIAEKNIMQSNWEYKKIKLYLN